MTAIQLSRRATVVAMAMVVAAAGVATATAVPERDAPPSRAAAPPKIISIVPQGAFASSPSQDGPVLSGSGSGSMRVGFVIPPDRLTDKPLKMRVVYLEGSAGACSWLVSGSGLEGPDGPNTQDNVHNGGWQPPGETGYTGLVNVPAGSGYAHTAIFKWPFDAKPGMFVQFALDRNGSDPTDTCNSVTITGLELRYS